MGKNSHCSVEKRKFIWYRYETGTKQSKIAEILNCYGTIVYNATENVKLDSNLLKNNKIRKAPPRKTTIREDRVIARK